MTWGIASDSPGIIIWRAMERPLTRIAGADEAQRLRRGGDDDQDDFVCETQCACLATRQQTQQNKQNLLIRGTRGSMAVLGGTWTEVALPFGLPRTFFFLAAVGIRGVVVFLVLVLVLCSVYSVNTKFTAPPPQIF